MMSFLWKEHLESILQREGVIAYVVTPVLAKFTNKGRCIRYAQ